MLRTATMRTTETETTSVPAEVEIPREALTRQRERDSLITKAREMGISERKIANTERGSCDQQVGEQVQLLHRLIAAHCEREAHPQSGLLSRIRAAIGL